MIQKVAQVVSVILNIFAKFINVWLELVAKFTVFFAVQ